MTFEHLVLKYLGDVSELADLADIRARFEASGFKEFGQWHFHEAYRIEFPIRFKGGNSLKGIKPYEYRAYREDIRARMIDHFYSNPPPPKAEKWAILFNRRGKRRMDQDNLTFGVKPFLDVLQEELMVMSEDILSHEMEKRRILIDDDPAHISLRVTQSKGENQVTLLLFPLF
jgi:hypothetical protein